MESDFGSANDSDWGSSWQIEHPVIKCDVCQMDSELNNEFAQRFLSGQTIPISYSTFVVQQQTLAGQTPSVNITRALSRLKSVFFTLVGAPGAPATNDSLAKFRYMFLRDWNNFYHPMASSHLYDANQEFEVSLQIGEKKFPEYPSRSQAETYSALRKCLGIQQSSFHSIDIDHIEATIARNARTTIARDTRSTVARDTRSTVARDTTVTRDTTT